MPPSRLLPLWMSVLGETYRGFNRSDAWALASHIALNALLALFPFLIFLTALASFFGTQELADQVIAALFESWPQRVAAPLAGEVRAVLTGQRRDLLTIGGLLALWFSSSGIEALRVGLDRAYEIRDPRSFFVTRLQSLGLVILGAAGLLAIGLLLAVETSAWLLVAEYLPSLSGWQGHAVMLRRGLALGFLICGLMALHLWLPAGRRRMRDVVPGIVLTLLFWLCGGVAFAWYLARFASYASTYAGFAGAMVALVFLYLIAVIFLIGGEFNAALLRHREARLQDVIEKFAAAIRH